MGKYLVLRSVALKLRASKSEAYETWQLLWKQDYQFLILLNETVRVGKKLFLYKTHMVFNKWFLKDFCIERLRLEVRDMINNIITLQYVLN